MNQMVKERREAYVEVLEILKYMDKRDVAKIPLDLREFFERNASEEYEFLIDKSIPLEQHILKENTINILAMLNINYWCEDEKHKQELLRKYHENDIEKEEKLKSKYNTDNLFKKERKIISVSNQENANNFPQQYEEQKWYVVLYETVYEFISKFIRRIFD